MAPKVKQYQADQVGTAVIQQRRMSGPALSAPKGAFGVNPQALQGLGDAAAQMQNRIDTTAAEEALVAFEKEKNALFFNPENGYFNTQGRNAYDGAQATSKALEELKTKYSDGLSEGASRLFGRTADVHIGKANTDIMRHSAKGLQAWEIATNEAQAENAQENAALHWGNPKELRVQRALGEQAILDASQRQGIGAEATAERLQTYRSSFMATAITAATAQGSANGKALMDKYGDQLEGPQRLKVQGLIDQKAKAEHTAYQARLVTTEGDRLASQYSTLGEMEEEILKIEDLDLQKKVRSEARSRYNQQKQIEAENRGIAFESAEDYMAQPNATIEQWKIDNPGQWEQLSGKQQRSLTKGATIETDWTVYNELRTSPSLATIDLTQHFPNLAKAERKSLINAQAVLRGKGSEADRLKAQAGRAWSTQVSAALSEIRGGKKSKNRDDIRWDNQFYELVDNEINERTRIKGSELTPQERTEVLNGITRQVVFERPWFLPDSTTSVDDIPADDLQVLSNLLRENGIPVTAENLLSAYEQASN